LKHGVVFCWPLSLNPKELCALLKVLFCRFLFLDYRYGRTSLVCFLVGSFLLSEHVVVNTVPWFPHFGKVTETVAKVTFHVNFALLSFTGPCFWHI